MKRSVNISAVLVILVSLLLSNLPLQGFAMSGVDLSRIKFSDAEKMVRFQFGDMGIEGRLYQVYPFTEAEIEDIAKKVLKEKGLTQLDLVEMNRAVMKAMRASSFTQEDYDQWKEDMLTTLSLFPSLQEYVEAGKLVNKYMTSKSWDDIGMVSTDYLTEKMSDQVKDSATGYIAEAVGIGADFEVAKDWMGKITAIVEFTEVMANSYARNKQKWIDIAEGANSKRSLNEFYARLQEWIDDYKTQSDETGWKILFDDQPTYRYFSFCGVSGNQQTVSLQAELPQITTDAYGSVAGTYEGQFVLAFEHDMSSFAKNLHIAADQWDPLIQLKKVYEGEPNFSVSYQPGDAGIIELSRTIVGNCTIEIYEDASANMDLEIYTDDTDVSFNGLRVNFALSVKNDNWGKVLEFAIPIAVTAEGEEMFVQSEELTVAGSRPDVTVDERFSGMDTPQSVGWDDEIWRHWNGRTKKFMLLD